MKSDLDALMEAAGLDALLVTGSVAHNPEMYYFTGDAHMGEADLIKLRGKDPVLFYNPMEREEAARTGLVTRGYSEFPLTQLIEQAGGSMIKAKALRYQKMLAAAGFTGGRLALHGKTNAGTAYEVFRELERLSPEIQVTGPGSVDVIIKARATKDAREVERMRRMGQITTGVVGKVAAFLGNQRAKDGQLIDESGQPVTIGQVKRLINLWLAEAGAENPEGVIFAQGRDAGIPHSTGQNDDVLQLGKTIVFDIFPCEGGGGYYYDFTRTWCLGYAPAAEQKLYDDVLSVYNKVMAELRLGEACAQYQRMTCELFEEQGHPTGLNGGTPDEGYVHSLGHGLGLNVHEAPTMRLTAGDDQRLDPGVVITFEPGLYYPERGMGCRLEDTLVVHADGRLEILAEYPLDLVIPVKQA